MKPVLFVPTEEEKKHAGAQATAILDALSKSTKDILLQAYMLQIVLECFESEYNLDIRKGYSISDDDRFRPKPKEG